MATESFPASEFPALAFAASGDPRFIAAVHEHRLVSAAKQVLAAEPENEFARFAIATCETISAAVTEEIDAVADVLTKLAPSTEGQDLRVVPDKDAGGQLHTMSVEVPGFAEAARVVARCRDLGYQPWEETRGAASEIFGRLNDHMTLIKAGPVSQVLIVRWPFESRLARIPRLLRPSSADWGRLDLPARLWPLYFLFRPLRLGAQKLGLITPVANQLGPFLVTPDSVMPALFSFAGVSRDDLVCDVGCGDGRLLITAGHMGCRALGIESDPALVAIARRNIEEAGLGDRVEIIVADAELYCWAESAPDVVFLFLPADVTAALLPSLLSTLEPGTRVVAHEQHRIPSEIAPQEREVLLGADSVTVAQLWLAG